MPVLKLVTNVLQFEKIGNMEKDIGWQIYIYGHLALLFLAFNRVAIVISSTGQWTVWSLCDLYTVPKFFPVMQWSLRRL